MPRPLPSRQADAWHGLETLVSRGRSLTSASESGTTLNPDPWPGFRLDQIYRRKRRADEGNAHPARIGGTTDADITPSPGPDLQSFTARSRSALAITLTEDSDMARAAMAGDSSRPKVGYNSPAATGMPSVL